ncbi:MAG: PepSY domain-containing protein, partial [Methylobacterium sp.]
KKEGFTKWKEIELDDGFIEVDDAIGADGKQFDLKLDPKTLEIVKRKAE